MLPLIMTMARWGLRIRVVIVKVNNVKQSLAFVLMWSVSPQSTIKDGLFSHNSLTEVDFCRQHASSVVSKQQRELRLRRKYALVLSSLMRWLEQGKVAKTSHIISVHELATNRPNR